MPVDLSICLVVSAILPGFKAATPKLTSKKTLATSQGIVAMQCRVRVNGMIQPCPRNRSTWFDRLYNFLQSPTLR